MVEFKSIKEAMEQGEGDVALRGWVYRERGSKKLKFIVLRDSTQVMQCIVSRDAVGDEKFELADKVQVEASMKVWGTIKRDDRAPSGYEVQVSDFEVVGESDQFPITKDQSPEFLLDIRHLSLRTRRQTAILKIRSTYVQIREEFFQKEGFCRFDAPILQPSQSEGGSTLFEVKYYDKTTYLSQSWQLYAEAAIFALEKIYNFGPTFRAEKSKTSRHLSEFWMAEMEAAWFDLKMTSEFAKKELKYCISETARRCRGEFELLDQDSDVLIAMCEKDWPTIKYRDAVKLIKEKDGIDVPFGKDLRTEEERAIMSHFDTPVAITHYPVEAMAFYKPRDGEQPDEALCFDVLAPQTGVEIVGGSERSLDIDDMKARLEAEGEDVENYQWYFDLRRYGSVPHSGYGVGTERVIAWITGIDNIKDAIPFPRTMLRYKP
ncbi:MAG: asparagine--tRNA ligase [Nanoarchaeota archaeon]